MTQFPLISVIVPIYKTEAYLQACVDSILKQTYPEIEIVLVNDGSPDNSLLICQDYAQRYAQIKVVDKANGGLSSARNAGLEAMSGEWVLFVDSDDWIDETMIEVLYESAVGQSAEISVCGYIKYMADRTQELKVLQISQSRFSYLEALEHILLGTDFSQSVCNKLIARTLIGSDRFDETFLVGEDTPFLVAMLARSKSDVAYTPTPFYHYRYTPGSITTSFSSKQLTAIEAKRYVVTILGPVSKELYDLAKAVMVRSGAILVTKCYEQGLKAHIPSLIRIIKPDAVTMLKSKHIPTKHKLFTLLTIYSPRAGYRLWETLQSGKV